MFRQLKKIGLSTYFKFTRLTQRERVIKLLTGTSKKRAIDIDTIPAALDDLKKLPSKWKDTISIVGFDNTGLCVRIKAQKSHKGYQALLFDLDLPGQGYFHHHETGFTSPTSNNIDWCFGIRRIKLMCLDPMKRWKIYFKGPLENRHAETKRVHATASLYWACLFDPYDHLLSPSCWKLADFFSSFRNKDIYQASIFNNGVSYEQWGELRGIIKIGMNPEIAVRLKCIRDRNIKLETLNDITPVSRQHFVVNQSGLSFSNQEMKLGNHSFNSGYVSFPIADNVSASLHKRSTCESLDSHVITQSISADNMTYHVTEALTRACFNNDKTKFKFVNLTMNGREGFGVQYFHDTSLTHPRNTVCQTENTEYQTGNTPHQTGNNLCQTFDHNQLGYSSVSGSTEYTDHDGKLKREQHKIVCIDSQSCGSLKPIMGGKAYNLFILKSSMKLNIPRAFCITTLAFQNHISSHGNLEKAKQEIETSIKTISLDLLKQKCDAAVELLQHIPLNKEIQDKVRTYLNGTFGREWADMSFAVRSSSVSEDGLETSAAGQMHTCLSVRGFGKIISAIQQCLASSVSYQVVEYRRQNGQEPIESLGVIVQEMVDADIAGAMFTADPVTGNGSNLVINANYGLGESVVSGTFNADTVVVNRTDDGKLLITKHQTSTENTKTVSADKNGIKHDAVAKLDKKRLCINDTDIVHLVENGIYIENLFGFPQDIEWAISNGKLYILQSRPISVLDIEKDEELMHEFDSPLLSDQEFLTPCNLEEMMPGVMTPLTGDLFMRAASRAVLYNIASRLRVKPTVHGLVQTKSICGHPLINMDGWVLRDIASLGGGENMKSNSEVAIVGEPVNEHTIENVKEFYGRSITYWDKLCNALLNILFLKRRDSKLYSNIVNETETLSFETCTDTALNLYNWIDDNTIIYHNMWLAYNFKYTVSIGAYSTIMRFLKGSSTEINVTHMSDMSLILSACQNLISGEVPMLIHTIAKQIAKSNMKEEFINLPVDACDSYLRSSRNEQLRLDYIFFMEQHGYRCKREPEFIDKSWSQDPTLIIQTIQLLVREGTFQEKETQHHTIDEIIDKLQTNLSKSKKVLLKLIFFERAMKEVATRETAKAQTMRVTNVFRQAYWKLAELLVKESRLPEPELLFFLTHVEIGKLIEHRSARLVRLAKKRKRLQPKMYKIRYPKINIGMPQPMQSEKPNYQHCSVFTMHGVPVSQGRIEGRAYLVNSLADKDKLLEGDVMICKATDVGMSPLYPLIGGLATEIGSVLSHGAVVAREYGLPCVVNINGVTDKIKTGDRVVLDGTKGTLTKL